MKVEVSEFINSGIMDGEARALEYFSLVMPNLTMAERLSQLYHHHYLLSYLPAHVYPSASSYS